MRENDIILFLMSSTHKYFNLKNFSTFFNLFNLVKLLYYFLYQLSMFFIISCAPVPLLTYPTTFISLLAFYKLRI